MSGENISDVTYPHNFSTYSSFCDPLSPRTFVVYFVTLGIAGLLSFGTLIIIPCHRQLRQRRFIFQCNIVLADFVAIFVATVLGSLTYVKDRRTDFLLSLRFIIVLGTNVSLINIFFVAVYQLITIRIDPFGVRNIITTPRCIVACIASWLTSFSSVVFLERNTNEYKPSAELGATSLQMVLCLLTGMCLCLIYRAVTKASFTGNIQMTERKEENKRLLRTFAMVYGTTLISATLSLCLSVTVHRDGMHKVLYEGCWYFSVLLCTVLNLITNSLVYWWRLKEFRSMLRCKRRRVVAINVDA